MRAAIAGFLLGATLASHARADCSAAPVAELLWSFPEDGDEDVPRDTLLWVVLNFGHRAAGARLDGVALDVADAARFGPAAAIDLQQLGLLSTGEHTVEVDLPGVAAPVALTFTVGANTAEPPAVPYVASVSVTADAPTGICGSILAASDCFDTGQDAHYVADASDAPLAYLVTPFNADGRQAGATVVWPVECGAPTFFGHSGGACLGVAAVGAAGASEASEPVCVGDLPTSCAGCASSDATAAHVFALLALLRIVRAKRDGVRR